MDKSVVVVANHSLFAQGVVSRLRQHLSTAMLSSVDPSQADATERIVAAQPAVVLLVGSSPDFARLCRVDELLRALPGLKIIRVDMGEQQAQVMTSQRCPVANVRDLADMIVA